MNKIRIKLFLVIALGCFELFANDIEVLQERDWTSSDGRTVKATLQKAQDENVTLKMANGGKIHTLKLESLSEKDQDLISSHQEKAVEIIKKHNSKIKSYVWYSDWYHRGHIYSTLPELALDEILLIYRFGLERELELFAITFTPSKYRIDGEKLTSLIMGEEGFVVKAKAANGWAFADSGKDLNVRPRVISKGSSDMAKNVFTINVNTRLIFPNGRSISESEFGIEKVMLLSLDNFEPRSVRR